MIHNAHKTLPVISPLKVLKSSKTTSPFTLSVMCCVCRWPNWQEMQRCDSHHWITGLQYSWCDVIEARCFWVTELCRISVHQFSTDGCSDFTFNMGYHNGMCICEHVFFFSFSTFPEHIKFTLIIWFRFTLLLKG